MAEREEAVEKCARALEAARDLLDRRPVQPEQVARAAFLLERLEDDLRRVPRWRLD